MATRQDDNIYKCAKRMVTKYEKGKCPKLNGEFSKEVQVEIRRMKGHYLKAQEV